MPRPRSEPLFELGGQWIASTTHRRAFYRHWTDEGAGVTRRQSLGTTDLETAKRRLAEIVVAGAKKTADSLLAAVLLDYFTQRTDKLPSKKQSRNAGRILLKCWGNATRVSEITDARQRAFAQWCTEQGFSLSYAARNATVLKAALNHAGVMPPSKIICTEGKMRERWGVTGRTAERAFIPSDAELVRFFRAEMPVSLRRWAFVCLLTACRPSAALDLAPASRQRICGLIDLNPKGRAQSKKYRALVREPRALTALLGKWQREGLDGFGGRYCGYATIEGVKTALERVRVRDEVNLPALSTYSFRHKAASVLRLARVPEDQIALQLGHKRPDLRSTAGYGEFDPQYLHAAAGALDRWFLRLHRAVKTANSHAIRTQAKQATKRAA